MNHEEYLPEKKIKRILETFLASKGWESEVDGLVSHSIDIVARRGRLKWVITVKGAESQPPLIIESFTAALGGILRRMDDKNCKYSIALPDTKPFRRLWERLPALTKDRTGITALFVGPAGNVEETDR